MADLTDMQRNLLAKGLNQGPMMGGASPTVPSTMQAPFVAPGVRNLPPAVGQALTPYQGLPPPPGQRDFVTGTPPPFSGTNPDPMTAIQPAQPPSFDRGGEINQRALIMPPRSRRI